MSEKENTMKIALAFSGGGYRASAFSLGTLTYLDKVKIKKEKSLLSHVTILSTVSGGTITGAKYATGIKKGESLQNIYAFLYKFFEEVDLISESTKLLNSPTHWQGERVKSLINAFADIYDERLFEKDKFGLLLNEMSPIHLEHISFNATEFTNGLQFRFLVSDKSAKGIIGNFKIRIPEEIAKEIRMADILAASSCFPAGFEPIIFPTDFSLPKNELTCVGLMDGGIVDNQGIEPILLAEERMRNESGKDDNSLDLVIFSDVSSPYMEGFEPNVQAKENWWRRLTIQKVKIIATLTLIASLLAMISLFFCPKVIVAILATAVLVVSAILLRVIYFITKNVTNNGLIDSSKLERFLHVKLGVFEVLLINRVNSVLKLVSSVFMKHIRRLNYNKIYDKDKKRWKNRRIMNGIHELTKKEVESRIKEEKIISKYLKPSEKIQEASEIAYNMKTTLWFDEESKEKNMLNTVIACEQYTTCWNLLEYIEYIKLDKENTNESHDELLNCEQQLIEDWGKFQKDPYWFVNQYNSESINVTFKL